MDRTEESTSLLVAGTQPDVILLGPTNLDREMRLDGVTFGVVKFSHVPFREGREGCGSRFVRYR